MSKLRYKHPSDPSLSQTWGLDPNSVQTAVSCSHAMALPPSASLLLLYEGGAGEAFSTRYCQWYNGLCVQSCYCLGCGEVIQWHFNRLSAFFAVALVFICRIKSQPVRHWICCLVVERRGTGEQREWQWTLPCVQARCAYQRQTKVFSLQTSDLWWQEGLLTHMTGSEGTELLFISDKLQIFTCQSILHDHQPKLKLKRNHFLMFILSLKDFCQII